jgi:insulysin
MMNLQSTRFSRDSKTLELAFQFPSIEGYYKSKPGKYLSHLIGHESEGSILSALKSKSWANSLSSGVSQSYKDFAFLNVDIDLSEEGAEHIDEIISCVFSYVAMLKADGVKTWIAKEIKDISDLNYRFLEKTQPTNYVMKMASGMQTYEPETVVSSPYVVENVDVSIIPELLSLIRPDNMLVLYKNKSLTTTKKEKWYGTDYEDVKFSTAQIDGWKQDANEPSSLWKTLLYVPTANPFIPEDFNIRCLNAQSTIDQSSVQLLSRVASGIVNDESVYSMEASATTAADPMKAEEVDGEEEDDEDGQATTSAPAQPMQLHSGKLVQSWYVFAHNN